MTRRSDTTTRALLIVGLLLSSLLAAAPYPWGMEPESAAYREGREALDRRDWRAAELAFQRAIEEDETPDAAYYWLAYAKAKRGQAPAALELLDELERGWPRSAWRDDARALRAELRRAGGNPPDEDQISDEELKLMALAGLAQTDPERAMPLVEKILRGDGSHELKEQALFVAGQMGGRAGSQMLQRVAREGADPDLQQSAIQYLAVLGGSETLPMLVELYDSGLGRDAKESILQAFMIAGAEDRLLAVARSESDAELRAEAVQLLGAQGAAEELWQLFQAERSDEVREAILQGLMISGDTAHLLAVARDPQVSEELRDTAIQLLGVQGEHEALMEIFGAAKSVELKSQIVQALGIGGRVKALETIAVDRSQPREVREEAVLALGIHGGGEVLWRLLEAGEPELGEEIMQGLALSGQGERLLAVIADAGRALEVREHAMESLIMTGPDPGELLRIYRSLSEAELKEGALNVLFASGAAAELAEVVRTESDRELRALAVQYLGLTGSPLAADVLEAILEE